MNEKRAEGVFYDAAVDVARVGIGLPPGTVKTRTVDATLLLDAAGFLVGIDVSPDGPGRTIVMLGAHENVAQTRPARVGVSMDAAGAVFEVRIANARALVRSDERNPYLP